MALRFFDSFDHYATADQAAKYTSVVANTITTSAGRNGTSGLRFTGSTGRADLTLDAQATWIVGFAYKTNRGSATSNGIVRFVDGGTLHVDLRHDASGNLFVTRNGTTLATGTAVLAANTSYYIEIKVTIADAGGVAVVKVDGVTDINFSGDTRNAGNASANIVSLAGSTSVTSDIDDYYICDGTGSSPYNDFLGDCRVEALFPNGNGNSSVLVGSDGNSTDNYLLVDETAPATADYVESSTVGDKDTYTYTNLTATSGTVYGVAVRPYAAKTDAGSRSIVAVARVSTTEVDSSALTLSNTATYPLEAPRTTKPGGGSWSISDVNGAEFGAKVNA